MSTDRALYEKMYAAQLAEGHDLETAMRYNKAATPEDFLRAFGQSSDPRHQHRKWGGGNKMGSGGAAVNAARRARAEARKSAPDANVNNYTNKNLADHLGLGRFFSKIDAHVNDRQGKPLAPNPSFVGVGANPSFQSVGTQVGNMIGATPSIGSYGDVSSFSNFTGGLPSVDAGSFLGDTSLSNLSSFSPGSFLSSFINGLQDNSFQIASHDRPLSRYPAANADDRWPGMSTDDIKRLVHPSLDPLMHIRDLPFGMQV
jgi:hypothetical protein